MTKDKQEQLKEYLAKFCLQAMEVNMRYGKTWEEANNDWEDLLDEAINEISKMLL